ncbi:pregnancy-associated plasma -A family protein, partial [Vibrio harveyi]
LRLYR